MKYFKDENNNLFGLADDGTQDDSIQDNFISITVEEANAILLSNAPSMSQEDLAAKVQYEKQLAINNITVRTVSGKEFDGDDLSINRMVAALKIAEYTGQTSTGWKLADNTTQSVTVAELEEALALSMSQVGKIVGAIA